MEDLESVICDPAEEPLGTCSEIVVETLNAPSSPLKVSTHSFNQIGQDFEVDFQSHLAVDGEASSDEPTVNAKELEKQFLRDQYHAGTWAPHPEFYLPDDAFLNDDEISVFAKLKTTMHLITDSVYSEQYIYKSLLHEGSGVPLDRKDIVIVHYAAFIDFADEPVDVAYSRVMKRPLKIQLSRGNSLPGFENSIRSMTPGEEAIFIVSSSLAYGVQGCPPRYPGNAEVFYFIELVRVVPKDDLELVMQLPSEERERLSFSTVKKVLNKCLKHVNFFFSKSDFRRATSYSRWAIDLLEHCYVADETEDAERNRLLAGAYTNGAVIAHRAKLPKSVLFHTGNVLKLEPNHRKALYLRIAGLIALKSLQDAIILTKKAMTFYPGNEHFAKQLHVIDSALQLQRQKEKDLCARMLGLGKDLHTGSSGTVATVPPTDEIHKNPSQTDRQEILNLLSDFKKHTQSREKLLDIQSFPLNKMLILDEITKELGLKMRIVNNNQLALRRIEDDAA